MNVHMVSGTIYLDGAQPLDVVTFVRKFADVNETHQPRKKRARRPA